MVQYIFIEQMVKGSGLLNHLGTNIVTREHAKGDVAARGSALALLLYLWGRDQGLEIFGEAQLAQAWGSLAP